MNCWSKCRLQSEETDAATLDAEMYARVGLSADMKPNIEVEGCIEGNMEVERNIDHKVNSSCANMTIKQTKIDELFNK